MSEINKENNNNEQKLVNNFLEDVKKRLPFWIRDQKNDVDEIIEELENHIWDRATELAEGNDPSPEQIEQVINQMGSPGKIASEYKRRGKPKYFITEELWPQYLRSLMIFGAIFVGLNIIISLLRIGSHTAGAIFGGIFQGIFSSLAIVVVLTTAIFVFLSHEGYLPADLEGKVPFFIINIELCRSRKADRAYAAEPAVKQEKVTVGTRPLPRTIEKRVYREPRTVFVERDRPKRAHKHYLGRDYLGEGISGIIFGTVVMVLPFMPFLEFLAMPTLLKYWLLIFGGLVLAAGLIRFMQAIIGRMLRFQQVLMFFGMVPSALNIPLFLALKHRPDILLTWLQDILSKWITADNVQLMVTVLVWFTVAVTALKLVSELTRIIKLEVNGFPE